MSVPRTRRNTSVMEFLHNAMQIEIYTRQKCKKFPKSKHFTTCAALIALAREARGLLARGNEIHPRSVTRQRRKLRKLRRLLDNGVLLPDDVYNSFQSWSSHSRRFDAW